MWPYYSTNKKRPINPPTPKLTPLLGDVKLWAKTIISYFTYISKLYISNIDKHPFSTYIPARKPLC